MARRARAPQGADSSFIQSNRCRDQPFHTLAIQRTEWAGKRRATPQLLGFAWWSYGCRPTMSSAVLFVGYLLHPVSGFAVERLGDRDVRHCRGRRCTMPVLLTG